MTKTKLYSIVTAILLAMMLFVSVPLSACQKETVPDDKPSTATVTGITLDTTDVKKEFDFAETFTYDGLKVTAQMSDKTTKNVDLKDCKITEPDTSRAGKRNVMIAYEGKTATYQVTVNKRVYPEITKEALLNITGENDSVAYRVEAENIDTDISAVKKLDSKANFVAQAPEGAEITSGNQYLTNYGVKYNYFGFKFNSDKAYEGVTIVLRLAYSGTGAIALADNFAMYINREDTDDGVAGQISMEGYSVSGGVCAWADIVLRNQSIKEGENTMTFEALSATVPDIDYVDFYVGMRYISSIVEMSEQTEYVKEIEDFDTEKANTRADVAAAHGLKDGQLFVETVTKESEGKTTSGGTSVGAIAKGSQLSTTLRLAQNATVKINFIASAVGKGAYKVKDHWKFTIDGITLTSIEDTNIEGGNASTGEYWDWIPTTLGIYNLPAGDHLFLIETTGTDCNVDCMKFEVISLGEYDESGIEVGEHICTSKCETCGKCTNADCTEEACKEKCECVPATFDATITGIGTVRAEAENLNTSKWVHQEGVSAFTESWSNDFGSGTCAKGLGQGTVITVSVKVEKACTLALGMVMSHYDNETYDFSDKEMKFGTTALTATPAGTFGHREATDYWKWVDVSLGTVEVEAGEYVLSVAIYGVNIDYFYFTVVDGNFDATITGAGTVRAEAENLDTTNWVHQAGVSTFTEGWNNDFGSGTCAKGLGQGTVITVAVKVEKACTLALGVVMSHYDNETYDFSNKEMKFGTTALTATPAGTFGHREATDYWKWVDVSLGTVEVEAGEYMLSVDFYGVNIDYFYFTVVDGTVAATGTTIEMENLTEYKVNTRPDFVNAGVPAGTFRTEAATGASGGNAICGFNDGSVFTVNIYVTEAGTYKISLVGACDADYPISSKMSFMLDGKEITVSNGNLLGTEAPTYWDWQTVELTSSELTVGVHTLTITIVSGQPNLDCVKIEAVTPSANV